MLPTTRAQKRANQLHRTLFLTPDDRILDGFDLRSEPPAVQDKSQTFQPKRRRPEPTLYNVSRKIDGTMARETQTAYTTKRNIPPAIESKARQMLQALHGVPGIEDRIGRAAWLAATPGAIGAGRGRVEALGYWEYIGGHGDVWIVPVEVARAVPHHPTSQDVYSITRHNYGVGVVEHECTCADARDAGRPGRAPVVPRIGVCCKHVLAYLMLKACNLIATVEVEP